MNPIATLALLLACAPLSSAQEQTEQLEALKNPDATLAQRQDACRKLALIGTAESVPALALLLGDPELSHMVRYALEPIPDPSVDAALRDALHTVKGRPLLGVIGSIGMRRDEQAVPTLAKLLADSDPAVAGAAARALGGIGTAAAAKALQSKLEGAPPVNISGVYPHLTMWNNGGECGTGGVVPWQGSLWAVTYSPHCPGGSDDKLYEITADLKQRIFEGSVGGTPANRMIHKESNQLLIASYLIDKDKNIRVIPPTRMFGRLTGNARHLTDPASKVYYATMEEGLYEVDVNTLDVKCFIRDGNGGAPDAGIRSRLPGYHGKGLYSGQGRVVYANNGDRGPRVKVDPTVKSGALAEWTGEGDWKLVHRNQFTEVSGPGGIHGNENPEKDPLWSMGWDARSLILALLDEGKWSYYRLPKGSHSYDGAHGWNTEWPRIREIGEKDLLATMHGTFWRFPASFSRRNSAGIAPRSNYLKVIGDFCRWNDRVVLGCDDSAQSEFLNKRPFKAKHGSPGQSNSNLWFIAPERLDELGPAIGRGSVWLRDNVQADTPSAPYLFDGYDHRQLHLTHQSASTVSFALEVDAHGNERWKPLCSIAVPPKGYVNHIFTEEEKGAWVRIRTDRNAARVTAHFQYRNADPRTPENHPIVAGVATPDRPATTGGLMGSLACNKLGVVAADEEGKPTGYYELGPKMELIRVNDPQAASALTAAVKQPLRSIEVDAASVVIIEDGKRYRLPGSRKDVRTTDEKVTEAPESRSRKHIEDYPADSLSKGASVPAGSTHEAFKGGNAVDGKTDEDSRWIAGVKGARRIGLDLPVVDQTAGFSQSRICREVATERDLLNIHGTFYELPARNAQGMAKVRPVATHNLAIHDFCSHNGLLFLTGIAADAKGEHIFRSADGKAAVWAGVVDDLWKLGKPRGKGGPWKNTPVKAGEYSDPYLMTAYDEKRVEVSASSDAAITLEVDLDGTGLWVPYKTFKLSSGKKTTHSFPKGFSAYWVRAVSDTGTTATVILEYR